MVKRIPKWIWVECIVFLILQYLICSNVYLMGDDYMYGTFAHQGVFQPVFSYYFTGNGRWLLNILDSAELSFDRYLYIIITPWLILLLGLLLYRFICLLTKRDNPIILGITISLLSLINVQMTCETTYWITGAMNYLVPALLLISGMIATLRLRENTLIRKQKVLYATCCILSCLTMEQYAFMSFGWMLLIWSYDFLNDKKINKRNLVITVISLIALCTIIFAPGNFVRVDAAVAKGSSLSIKVMDLVYYDYYSTTSSTFVFVLSALCSLQYYYSHKKLLSALSVCNSAILLLCFDYRLIKANFILVIVSLLISFVTIFPSLVSAC